MAIQTYSIDMGGEESYTGARFDILYDDTTMKLIGIKIQNLSVRRIIFEMTSPRKMSYVWTAGMATDYSLPTGQRPTFSWGLDKEGRQIITGIEWRATLGI